MPYLKIASNTLALFAYSDNYHLLCIMKRTHRASYSVEGQADGLRPFLFSLFHQRNYSISKNEKRGLRAIS